MIAPLYCSQLVGLNGNARLPAHDVHQHPDAPVRRHELDCGDHIRKRSLCHRHFIAGLEKLRRQQLALLIAAQHQLADQIKRDWRRLFAKAAPILIRSHTSTATSFKRRIASGELAAITMRHRAQNGRVVLLNPFQEVFEQGTQLVYPDTGFNPLSIIDPALSTFKADCDVLARYLMVTDRKESGSYNDEGAEFLSLVIAGTVLYEKPALHNLPFVYDRVREDLDAPADLMLEPYLLALAPRMSRQ